MSTLISLLNGFQIRLPQFGEVYTLSELLAGVSRNKSGVEDLMEGLFYGLGTSVTPTDPDYNNRGLVFRHSLDFAVSEAYSYGNVNLGQFSL
jgi:hypothetical protein